MVDNVDFDNDVANLTERLERCAVALGKAEMTSKFQKLLLVILLAILLFGTHYHVNTMDDMRQQLELERTPVLALVKWLPHPSFHRSSAHSLELEAHKSKLSLVPGGWAPLSGAPKNGQDCSGHHLTVDLGNIFNIHEIEVSGRGSHDQFVKTYKIQHRKIETDNFEDLVGKDFQKYFDGPQSTFDTVKNRNFNPFHARFVRILPVTCIGYATLKWEVFGKAVVETCTE